MGGRFASLLAPSCPSPHKCTLIPLSPESAKPIVRSNRLFHSFLPVVSSDSSFSTIWVAIGPCFKSLRLSINWQNPQHFMGLSRGFTVFGKEFGKESLVPGLTRTRNTVDKLVSAVTTHAPQTAIALGVRDRPAF